MFSMLKVKLNEESFNYDSWDFSYIKVKLTHILPKKIITTNSLETNANNIHLHTHTIMHLCCKCYVAGVNGYKMINNVI